jgi:hypothetical protein
MSSKPSQCLLVGTVLTCPHQHHQPPVRNWSEGTFAARVVKIFGTPPTAPRHLKKDWMDQKRRILWAKLDKIGTIWHLPVRFCLRSHDLPEGQADAVSMEELIPDHGEPLEMRGQQNHWR